jgi:hypothetical protein
MTTRSLAIAWCACIALAYACTSPTGVQSPATAGNHPHKGGHHKGHDAREAHQHVGEHAAHDRDHGEHRGATYADLGCDGDLDGLAWCDSATEIAFCSAGEWWVLDCAHEDIAGDFCGDSGSTVDCYVAADF